MAKNSHKGETSYPGISNPDLRRVAVEAGCDPKTVIRYLRDRPVHATAIGRIARALTACGFAQFVKGARRDSTPPRGDSA